MIKLDINFKYISKRATNVRQKMKKLQIKNPRYPHVANTFTLPILKAVLTSIKNIANPDKL